MDAILEQLKAFTGFEACKRWVVLAAEGQTSLRRLHAVDGTDASFLALDPRQVLEGYRCDLSDADRAPSERM